MAAIDKEARLAEEAAAAAQAAEEKARRLDPPFPYTALPFDAAFWLRGAL